MVLDKVRLKPGDRKRLGKGSPSASTNSTPVTNGINIKVSPQSVRGKNLVMNLGWANSVCLIVVTYPCDELTITMIWKSKPDISTSSSANSEETLVQKSTTIFGGKWLSDVARNGVSRR